MLKRPILFAAMAAAMVFGLLCHVCPDLFRDKVPFREDERFLISGSVLQTVTHTNSVDVYLSRVTITRRQDLAQGIRYGKAVLVLSVEEAQALSLKAGYKVSSYASYRPFRTAANLGNYDERAYYAAFGIFVRMESVRTQVVEHSVQWFREILHEIRASLVRSIHAAVGDPEAAGILAAICIGDREGLSRDAKKLYQKSGIIHILAISGLHISLLGMTIFRLLRRRLSLLPASLIAVSVMLGFCVMSGASASAVRATIMFVIQMLGICLGKNVDSLCSWSAAFLLMICYRPLLITSSGFVLSFLAVLATGTLFRSLCAFFGIVRKNGYEMKDLPDAGRDEEARGHGQTTRNEWGRKLAESFLMSLSVNLLLLPVMASVYYEIPVYAILLNLLIIPLMSVVLGLGFVSALLGLIRVMLGRFFVGAGVYLVRFIEWSCKVTGSLPGSNVITGCPELWRLALYYGILLVVHLVLLRRAETCTGLSAAGRHGKKVSGRRCIFLLVLTGLLLCVILAGKTPRMLRISFLNVGQGDGILIENPTGTVYLIDGGSSSVNQVGTYRMMGAIKYYGVSHIDYAIVTHPDSDHMSGLLEILSEMPDAGEGTEGTLSIGTILMPAVPDNSNYNDLCALAEQKGVEVAGLKAGMQIADGRLRLTCLYPETGQTFDTVNGYSAVLDLQYGAFTALLTGDLEEEGELFLLKEDADYLRRSYDVLKVAHHGSRFSSSADFLRRVRPSLAVISAGEHNRYGHPHKETLERLRDVGAGILVTSESREIILEADPAGNVHVRTPLQNQNS